MSIAVLPASSAAANHLTDPSFSVSAEPHLEVENEPFRHRVVPVRRRGNAEQGRALEMLGHAVEYLADSRLFLLEEVNQRDEDEAMQILMRMSREFMSRLKGLGYVLQLILCTRVHALPPCVRTLDAQSSDTYY